MSYLASTARDHQWQEKNGKWICARCQAVGYPQEGRSEPNRNMDAFHGKNGWFVPSNTSQLGLTCDEVIVARVMES